MEQTTAQRIRAEAKQVTRKALLSAALAETVEHGGTVPSIEAICARTGYTRGAFYFHFKNRAEFVVEMLGWVLGDIFEAIFVGAGAGAADLRTIVTRFTGALARREWPDVSDIRSAYLAVLIAVRGNQDVRDRHAAFMGAIIEGLEGAIREGQGSGAVREDIDPRRTAELLLLIAIALIAWDGIGIPLDPGALGESALGFVEKAARA